MANETAEADRAVRLVGVSKTYETQAARIIALEKMNWSIGGGEAAALMGPSGCGKTTILNLLGGMDRPSGGEIWVNGENVAGMTERQLERLTTDLGERHGVEALLVEHRIGRVLPGEAIVLVAVAADRRGPAQRCCQDLLEALKHDAPFWKREWSGGEGTWITGNTPL
jgi:ABC-type glutathione transport system ATPase component